jgi:nicotinate-nucleotide adenylyltransferase
MPKHSASAQQRLEMLCIAAAGIERLEVSDIELRRQGTSYTYETVMALRQQYPDAELTLLMGTDMFLSFGSWKNPQIITREARLGVLYRGERDEILAIRQQAQRMQEKGVSVVLVDNPVLAISSTDLRRMLVFGCADPELPEGVGEYIRQKGLYGTSKNRKGLTLEQLEAEVTGLLKPNRVAHVLGCRDTAIQLARRFGADENLAARAALLHDVTKALEPRLQLTLCKEYGIVPDEFSQKNPKTLHAFTGSLVAQRVFGEEEAVVEAIRWHTTGKAGMTLLEKIIYIADYMEPNRDFPGVQKLRELAYEDIDEAMMLGLKMTVALLQQQGRSVCPESKEALQWLQAGKECEIC